MINKIFKYACIATAISVLVLCFLPQGTGDPATEPAARYLVANMGGMGLLVAIFCGIGIGINRFRESRNQGPQTF